MEYRKSEVILVGSTKSHIPGIEPDYFPVAAARVSHGKDGKTGVNPEADIKLMNYLSEHKHTSPFEHTSATFKIVCPFFVAREWHRHRTQSFNEISMRYTSDTVGQMWKPDTMRKQSKSNKQCSEGELTELEATGAYLVLEELYHQSMIAYHTLLNLGVAREIARAVLPMGHMTEFYATANLHNWARFARLRISPDAQVEIRELAEKIHQELSIIYPNSWSILTKDIDING